MERDSTDEPIERPRLRARAHATCSTGARCGARSEGVDRVFHCAGVTSVRPADAERLFDVNVDGTKLVLEECLRAGVERVVYTSSAAAVGPGAARQDGGRDAALHGRTARHPVRELRPRGRGGGDARWRRSGLPLVCVNPAITFGAGDVHVTSTRLVRSFLLRPRARLRRRRDQRRGRARRGRGPPAGRRERRGGRALHPRRAQLHLRPPLRRPRPAHRRRAAGQAAARRPRARRRACCARRPGRAARRERGPAASQWWTYRCTKAKRELGWRARPHEETLEATVAWHLEREHDRIARSRARSSSSTGSRARPSARPRRRVALVRRVDALALSLASWPSLPLQGATDHVAAAAGWRGACARRGSSSRRSACRSSSATGPRSRS